MQNEWQAIKSILLFFSFLNEIHAKLYRMLSWKFSKGRSCRMHVYMRCKDESSIFRWIDEANNLISDQSDYNFDNPQLVAI